MAAGAHLNVTRLRVLHELADRGSLAAVADALWMTPSAVSQHVAALERETETQLVERAGRGVRLTQAGQILAEHAGRVLAALADADAALRALRTDPGGRLRIASFPSVVQRVLSPALAELRVRHPQLQLEIEDLEVEQALEALRLGRIDVAIVDHWGWEASAGRKGLEASELFADRLVLVMDEGDELASRAAVAWSDLAERPLILEQRSSAFSTTVVDACRRAGVEPLVQARVHDMSAMLALVRGAGYLCVLPELAVSRLDPAVTWVPLEPTVERQLLAATRTGFAELASVRALLERVSASSPA